jgi:ATP-dependent Clp protease ATP-binding subunit ClpA
LTFFKKKLSLLSDSVTEKDIAAVVARATGIPLNNLIGGEKERLLDMEKVLESKVIGQRQAIEAVANAIRVARAGLNPPTRPMGSFLFLGPTGVGKTLVNLLKLFYPSYLNLFSALQRSGQFPFPESKCYGTN